MMKIIKKYKVFDVLVVLLVLALMPIIEKSKNYILYQFEKSRVENIQTKQVVVFYDNFDDSHGNSVVNAFLSRIDLNATKRYEVLKINSKEIDVEIMEQMLTSLLKNNKRVFLNSSVTPMSGFSASRWQQTYKHLSKYKNMKITQAIGNNENTRELFGEDIDNQVYKLLDEKKKEIMKIVLNKEDNMIMNYGYFGQQYVLIKGAWNNGRNARMKSLITEVVDNVASNKCDLDKSKMVDTYTEVANIFSFAMLLSHENLGVTLVGSSSDIELTDGTTIKEFLDFPIDGLIRIDQRETAVLEEDTIIKIGTSFSAPMVLASFVNSHKY